MATMMPWFKGTEEKADDAAPAAEGEGKAVKDAADADAPKSTRSASKKTAAAVEAPVSETKKAR